MFAKFSNFFRQRINRKWFLFKGGFYRHLYEQKMGPKAPEDATKIETASTADHDNIDDESIKIKKNHVQKDRVYRKRKSSGQGASDDDEEETTTVDIKSTAKKAHLQSNLDADSDFSIDSDSDEEEKDHAEPVTQHNTTDVPTKNESQASNVATESDLNIESVKKDEKIESSDVPAPPPVADENNVEKATADEHKDEPKIDRKKIWEKRTVGDVLVGAIQRYFERKLLREG